jgi:REP element-mobilizing transposase RayT
MSARKAQAAARTLPGQTAFVLPTRRAHGGWRAGAGRKARRAGSWVTHGVRPWHDRHHPVHVTLRVRRGVPSLRGYRAAASILAGLRVAATSPAPERAARRDSFRVIHYSVQPDHLHLIVEATDRTALSRGMQGLASGLARRVNRRLGRRGALFADRYHAHTLAQPREVRNAIVYVLKNYEKHPELLPDRRTEPRHGLDPCSSAHWFDGWAESAHRQPRPPPVCAPRTWLLRVGWQRGGRIGRPAIR